MSCNFLDITCQLAPVIFWAKVIIAVVISVAVLAALAWVYRNFGWWGVAVAASAGIAALIFKQGVEIGRSWNYPKNPDKPIRKAPLNPDSVLQDIFNGNRKR